MLLRFILVSWFLVGLFVLSAWGQDSLQTDSILLSFTFEEEVVVTGQYAPTSIQKSVLPIKVIDQKAIAKRGATRFTEILQQESNITIRQDPVLGPQITLNGLDGQHVKILIDGVPMIGRNDGQLDLDRIPVQDIERIEIIENALSVTYGTNALAGTINIITKQKQKKHWAASLHTQVQSNQQYLVHATLAGSWKNLRIAGGYNFSHFAGFSTDTLRSMQWNPKQQHALHAKVNYSLPKSGFSMGYHFNMLRQKIDNMGVLKLGQFPTLSYAHDYVFRTNTQDHSLFFKGYPDKGKKYYLNAIAAFNNFDRKKVAYHRFLKENPSTDTIIPSNSDTTGLQAWNVRLTVASQAFPKIAVQVGLDFRYDYIRGARIVSDRAQVGDFAAFAMLDYKPIPSLKINLGLRLAYNTMVNFPFTYSAGFKWDVCAGMHLRFSYARGIRLPSLKELYMDFVDANHFIKGNAQLKPEYAHNLRLHYEYNTAIKQHHFVRFNTHVFYNYIEQQIQLASFTIDSATGGYIASPTSNEYTYFNLEKYQNVGGGLSIRYRYEGLQIQFGMTLIGHYNVISETDASLAPFLCTAEFSQEISYHFKKIGLQLSLFRRDYDQQIRYTATTDPITQETMINQTTLEGYGMMDFTISKTFFDESIKVSAGIKNILGVTDIVQGGNRPNTHQSGNRLAVGMERVFFVGLTVRPFDFGRSVFKK